MTAIDAFPGDVITVRDRPVVPPVEPPPVDPPATDPRLPSSNAIIVPAGQWLAAVRDAKNGDELAMPPGVSVFTGDVTTAIAAKSISIVPQASALLPMNADGTYPTGSLAVLEAQGASFYWYASGSGAGKLSLRDVSLRANTPGQAGEHGSALLAPMSGLAEVLLRRVAVIGDKDMQSGQQLVYVAPHAVGSASGGSIGSVLIEDCSLNGQGTSGFGLQVYGPGTVSSIVVRRTNVRNFPTRPGLMAWTTIQSYLVDDCDFSAVVNIFRNETATPTRIQNCRGTYLSAKFSGANASKIVESGNSFAKAA